MSATSRAYRAHGIYRTTQHTDKRAALYTAADRRPTNQVSAWLAERGSRPTRRHPREDPHEGTASVEFKLNHVIHNEGGGNDQPQQQQQQQPSGR